LKQKLQKIISSGRKKFQVYFAGHSIGGSLATLAAFDLQKSNVAKKIKVFSPAPLRLGDATYVAMVNSYITVYRIVKKSDYLVRIPNCYYSSTYKMWRCFNPSIVRSFILKPTFPLKIYVSSYLTYYTRTNTILRSAIVYARKRIILNRKANTHLALAHKKRIFARKNKIHKKVFKRNKYSIEKVLKNLKHKVHNSKKTLRKNPKKIQKKSNSIMKQLKKLKKKNGKKSSLAKKLKNLIKKGKKKLQQEN